MDAALKTQLTDKINKAANVLVTVNSNPTVDQLAAALGFTLLLNKLQKHATAVFSGQIPSTIEFLKPETTFETNTDSLRDFIISLDKDKADKLRYKIEGDLVKIYITPYHTSLGEKDLSYGQGDFNVELVVALGIKEKGQIDAAITAHGKILHDATVISINAGEGNPPDIGQINWFDKTASSLSEMLAGFGATLGQNLIDNQIATAFLTGIVAETDRFSSPKTTPKVMSISAQLMAAGANQQLIINKLKPPAPPPPPAAPPQMADSRSAHDGGTLMVEHPKPAPSAATPPKTIEAKPAEEKEPPPAKESQPAAMTLATLNAPAKDEEPDDPNEIHIDEEGNLMPARQKAGPGLKNEQVDKSDMPGSHAVLNPATKQPFIESAFTANTGPSFHSGEEEEAPIDPLSGSAPGQNKIFEHKMVVQPLGEANQSSQTAGGAIKPIVTAQAKVVPSHVDDARSAVENALTGAPAPAVAVGGESPPPVPPPLPHN